MPSSYHSSNNDELVDKWEQKGRRNSKVRGKLEAYGMLNAPKMAASVDALFNKLEERFKQIPTITLQEIPKIAIFIVVSSGRRLKVSPANPSHHTLVIDLRFQDGPKIEKKYGSLDKNIKFGKARGQVVIKFDGEDTFIGILQENTNLRKLVETGAVDIHGRKNC